MKDVKVFSILIEYFLFEECSQFLIADRKLLSLVNDGFGIFEGVEDGKVFVVEAFPPLFSPLLSVVLYFWISTQVVPAVLRCLHFTNRLSVWSLAKLLSFFTFFLKFSFRIIFSPRRLSFDLLNCPGTVNSYSYFNAGDILNRCFLSYQGQCESEVGILGWRIKLILIWYGSKLYLASN